MTHAEKSKNKTRQSYRRSENKHKRVVKSPGETRVERDGKNVHVYMSMIRSHFTPDNIEGIKVGDKVFFHITNLRSEEHTSELQSRGHLVCRLLLEKRKCTDI